MSDWFGLLFFILLLLGAFAGLKMLAKNRSRTEEEFERGAARSASLLGASVNALQEILDPAEARAKEVKAQLKQGSYNIKQREGKAEGENLDGENYE